MHALASLVVATVLARLLWMLFVSSPPQRLACQEVHKLVPGATVGHVSEIRTYPLKSGRPVSQPRASLDERGLLGDRCLLAAWSPTGAPLRKAKALNQKRRPQLATIAVRPAPAGTATPPFTPLRYHGQVVWDASDATSGSSGVDDAFLPPRVRLECTLVCKDAGAQPPAPIDVDVHAAVAAFKAGRLDAVKLHCVTADLNAVDLGDDVAKWMDAALHAATVAAAELGDGRKSGSVTATPGHRLLAVLPQSARYSRDVPLLGLGALAGHRMNGADVAPVMIANQASLASLNGALNAGPPVTMERFRPNVVVTGMPAWAEDHIARVRIGSTEFATVGPCSRCVMTTIDQETGIPGYRKYGVRRAEPLSTLRRLRSGGLARGWNGFLPVKMGGSHGAAPVFGWNVGPAASHKRGTPNGTARGSVKVGDPVVVLQLHRATLLERGLNFLSRFLGIM